ncbi:uncharacterized protein IUM83_11876 [Phytophthora cinnamomi]|uniref:uncharacterized protein n=1 Tax=Phytophthora cinnamomi TaxID=4785 RepID=UPI00355AC496|nr:hypothetical protein IUM83_11876 [Phytophthora cinnamomi]
MRPATLEKYSIIATVWTSVSSGYVDHGGAETLEGGAEEVVARHDGAAAAQSCAAQHIGNVGAPGDLRPADQRDAPGAQSKAASD